MLDVDKRLSDILLPTQTHSSMLREQRVYLCVITATLKYELMPVAPGVSTF